MYISQKERTWLSQSTLLWLFLRKSSLRLLNPRSSCNYLTNMGCEPSKKEQEPEFQELQSCIDLNKKETCFDQNDSSSKNISATTGRTPPASEKEFAKLEVEKSAPFETKEKEEPQRRKDGIELNAIVFQMNLEEYEMEDELSIIIDDLMGKYDQEEKGHLSVDEFEKLVKDNAKHCYTKNQITNMLGIIGSEADKEIDRIELYGLCLPSILK